DLGVRAATIAVVSNDPRPPPAVTLTGTGTAPRDISFDPTPTSFGDQAVGSTSAIRHVVVTNTSGRDVHIDAVAVDTDRPPGAFVVAQETCAGTTLTPGASCDIDVEFAPDRIGQSMSTLVLADSAGAKHATPLEGNGTGARVGFEPLALDFGEW